VFPLLTVFYYNFSINIPAQNLNEAEYEIKQGRPVAHIAKELYELKLINSEFLFNLYIKLSRLESDIQAGVYKIPAGASIVELVNIFQNGKNDRPVTFIEISVLRVC
jgi:cell division protein YceG involved in septum cleavage